MIINELYLENNCSQSTQIHTAPASRVRQSMIQLDFVPAILPE